ncbi:MAG TPA: 3'-5' exonuclease [Longimicrobiales bacterium]|nr:3'-5' exonuclease [Longimicrobiales bacterium]
MKEDLSAFFHIDRSDPSTGIKISLKQDKPKPPEQVRIIAPPPNPYIGPFEEGVRIVGGRVVRESRHPDSAYSTWAPVTGPAETELERKSAGGRKPTEPPVALNSLQYVVVDVETTGGGQMRGHRITEIAIVRVDAEGRQIHEYATLVNPGRTIPTEITRLTSIDHDMVRLAPRFEDIAQDVRSMLEGRVFVAHNAAFDWSFINGELIRTTGKPLLAKRLCTVRLSRKVVPEVRRRTLDALSYFFNVHNEARHRAYGDARATAVIFKQLLQRVWDHDIDTWQKLDRFVRAPKIKRKRSALPTPIEEV